MTTTTGERRAPGLRLHGEYAGSGYQQPRYLVTRADGQPVQLTRLLYEVLEALDGRRNDVDTAAEISARVGRELSPDGLHYLLDTKLRPLGLLADNHAAPVPAPRADPVLRVRLHATLIPARCARRIGRLLAPLFTPAMITASVVGLLAVDTWLITHASLADAIASLIITPGLLLASIAIMVAAALFHELGHAAGCVRGGGEPGAIGVGLYVVFPAFYTDVTDAYRLSTRGRLRTDLGGVYFSAIAALAAAAGYLGTGSPILLVVVLLAQLELAQQLLPLVRLDGYYILGDLTGIPDLFGKIKPIILGVLRRHPASAVERLRPHSRVIVTCWVCAVVPALTAGTVLLLLQLPTIIDATGAGWQAQWRLTQDGWRAGSPVAVTVSVITALLGSLPALGLALLATILTRRLLQLTRPRLRTVTTAALTRRMRMFDLAPVAQPRNGVAPERTANPTTQEATECGAEAFTDRAMLKPRPTPRTSGWQRAVQTASRGKINPRPSRHEREHELQLERVRARITGTRTIVVLSRKGGVGKTTTALMLGHTFASVRGDRVVALDANPDAGNLAHRIPRENASTVTTLAADAGTIQRYAEIRTHTSQADTRLEVVASDDDPRITAALGASDYHAIMDVLDKHYTLMLVDTGTGILDDAIQGLLARADQLVIVMSPALDGARVAASTLDWLTAHHHGSLVTSAVAVINGVHGNHGLVDLRRVDEHFAARCAAVVHIPRDRTLEAGAQVPLARLRPATRTAYLNLAAVVADQFANPTRNYDHSLQP